MRALLYSPPRSPSILSTSDISNITSYLFRRCPDQFSEHQSMYSDQVSVTGTHTTKGIIQLLKKVCCMVHSTVVYFKKSLLHWTHTADKLFFISSTRVCIGISDRPFISWSVARSLRKAIFEYHFFILATTRSWILSSSFFRLRASVI